MLNENIKTIRKSKGLSQEELAIKLNVVRQTVSKWEQGLSVPDSNMLISLSEVFETPVSTLLGEEIEESTPNELKSISEKLEVINLQLVRKKSQKQKIIHWLFISACVAIVTIFVFLFIINGSYMNWNYDNPETAVIGVGIHSFEWLFVRLAPFAFIGCVIGAILTRRK